MTLPASPNTRAEQFAFLRAAHDGPLSWRALCLSLARQAPGLPAVHPSALSAMHATPRSDRVHAVEDLRRGMVAYFDHPSDSNPYGHVVTVAGWAGGEPTDDLSDLLVWSNDAKRSGGVDLVRASFFPDRWGDPFTFGATSLNGYDLPGYQRRPPPATTGAAFNRAIAGVRSALRHHRAEQQQDPTNRRAALIAALLEDLDTLRQTRRRFAR